MNALPVGIYRPPTREDYESIVKGLTPFVGEEELTLRSSLLLMRDRAMATKPIANEYAWRLLDMVEILTSDNAMNPRVDVAGLREMRRVCLNVICAASNLDALYRSRAPDAPEAA